MGSSAVARVLLPILLIGCAQPSTPDPLPASACELGRYADFIGRFEVVTITPGRDSNGLADATVALVEPLIARPMNDTRTLPTDGPIERLRNARPGDRLITKLAIPPSATVVTGSPLVLFLAYSTRFETWADASAQGVFVSDAGKWMNGLVYANGLTEMELLAESARGAELSRSGTPPCDATPSADGGR